MFKGRRRLSLIVGLTLAVMTLALPAGVAARSAKMIPADVLGAHVWTATLCDGTAVSVRYHVTARGRLVVDGTSGTRARVRGGAHWFEVRFVGAHTRMGAWVHWRHRTLHLQDWSAQRPCPPPPDDDPPPDDGGNGQSG